MTDTRKYLNESKFALWIVRPKIEATIDFLENRKNNNYIIGKCLTICRKASSLFLKKNRL